VRFLSDVCPRGQVMTAAPCDDTSLVMLHLTVQWANIASLCEALPHCA